MGWDAVDLALEPKPEKQFEVYGSVSKENNNENEKDQSFSDAAFGTDHRQNGRSHTEMCQNMKSAVSGVWSEKQGEEPSMPRPTVNHMGKTWRK